MAVASSAITDTRKIKGSSTVSHSIFVNLEAEQSNTPNNESDDWDDDDDDDDEETTAERVRQAAESVPLRRRDQVDEVLEVAKKWEEYALQGELARQERHRKPRQTKRKQKADPPSLARSQKRARTLNNFPSPPPNTFPVEVKTCNGVVVIHVPEIPGEKETPREMRIYNLSEPFIRAADEQELSKIFAARGLAPAATLAYPATPNCALAASTPVAAPSPTIAEEWVGGAPTPISASTPPPCSPAALRARSSSPMVLEDWPDGVATPLACSRSPSQAPPALLPLFLPDNRSNGSTPAPSLPSADTEIDLINTVVNLPTPSNDLNIDETAKPSARQVYRLSSGVIVLSFIYSNPRITQGWRIAQRMLTSNMSLHEARTELHKLFGDDYENDIWVVCCRINDSDPDELEESRSEIIKELEAKMGVERDADLEIALITMDEEHGTMNFETETEEESDGEEFLMEEQKLLAAWVARNYNGNTSLLGYRIFALRCMRGRETAAIEKIWCDLEANRLHPSVLRNAFKSRCPGYIYIQAYSMLPKHTKLAAYLRTVPDLFYHSYFKFSHPGENAWSRRNERVKRQPPPAVKSHDLNMPIWLRVEDVHFNRQGIETTYAPDVNDNVDPPTVRERIFRPDTWAIIKSGRYKGDLGIVIQDDFDETDTSIYALLKVIPRIKFPGSLRTRPPKAPLPVDFSLTPATAWESFIASKQVTVSCIEEKCTDPWNCDHQEYWMKRYRLFKQTIRGGFVLINVKLCRLDVALRVPDDELAIFETIAEGDPLGNVPPLASWTFQEKETVILTHHTGISSALPGTQGKSELGNLPDGTEGVIEKVCDLVCEVAFTHQGQVLGLRSVAYRNLVKKLAVGQAVRLSSGIRTFKERRWTQRGDWGVFTLKETQLELAKSKGLVTSIFMHPLHGPSVSVWIQEHSTIITLNPNTLVDVTFEQSGNFSYPVGAHEESLIPLETTICDIRDISVIERSHSQLAKDKTSNLETLHPEEYFAQQAFRRSGRMPWFGVRVYVTEEEREDRRGWSGQVKEVVPDVENSSKFFVLIQWDKSSLFSGQFFDWCRYDNVRRLDNYALLHEFTPFTGNSPWKGVRVKVIKQGVYKDREAQVLDSRADPILDLDTVSGMSVLLYFLDGTMAQENRTAWIDYHYVRRCDIKPMRFLHESALAGKGSASYYVFKLGYEPTYTPQEIEAFQTSQALPIQFSEPTHEDSSPQPPSSLYFRFEATWEGSAPASDIPETFWLLDRRIWQTLGNREIDVARTDRMGDLRLSVKHLGSGAISLQSHITRPGGGNHDFNPIHPGIISQTPWSCSVNRSTSASGLYIICDLEPYTGRLARRVQYSRATDEKADRWVLQLVSWTQPTIGMDHTEILVKEPFIRTTRDHFVLVHETLGTLNKANELMCRLREKECAPTNGYKVNEAGQVVNIKTKRRSKKA